jgi:hypothetical protein
MRSWNFRARLARASAETRLGQSGPERQMSMKPELDARNESLMLSKIKRQMTSDLNSLPEHPANEEEPMLDLQRVLREYLESHPNDGKQFALGYLAALGATTIKQLDNDQRDKFAITLINLLHPTK